MNAATLALFLTCVWFVPTVGMEPLLAVLSYSLLHMLIASLLKDLSAWLRAFLNEYYGGQGNVRRHNRSLRFIRHKNELIP
jgi:hypothetical protein